MEAVKTKQGFYVELMYTGCLAEAAYYIESDGEAAIIDPMRETGPYIELATKRGAKIKYVFETHFHADFVSGHVDLARRTGADIVFGPTAQTEYTSITAEDGQVFEIGNIKIVVLHTPGHTPESSSYLLIDENGVEHAVFSGDTLFIGEVGRPDLAVKSDLTKEDLAGMLFDSLRNKIMPLPDEVIVYPGHGAGSACGKNISDKSWDTLGNQKLTNYALQDMPKEVFIERVTEGILPPPQYFPKNALLNKMGTEDIDEILLKNTQALTVEDVISGVEQGAIIIDSRHQTIFGKGFIPGSIAISLDGGFAGWVGTLIEDLSQPIILITEPGREREAVLRLARVGYNRALGYLQGGIEAWENSGRELETIEELTAEQFAAIYEQVQETSIDVRKPTEYEAEHVTDLGNYPLNYIYDHLDDLRKDKTWYLHCKSGYRSMTACSLLRKHGYQNVVNIEGGMEALLETDLPITEYVCPTTR